MHAACLVAEYETYAAAKVGLEVLRKFDFASDAISVAWRGHEKALQKVDRDDDDDDAHGVEKSMALGALIASIVGVPLGITSIMGPIMVAGPLAALAGGAAVGGAAAEAARFQKPHPSRSDGVDTRGLFAMANRWGINAHLASHYEERIQEGAILIIVTSTPPRLDVAEQGLKTTNPASLQRFAFRRPTDAGVNRE